MTASQIPRGILVLLILLLVGEVVDVTVRSKDSVSIDFYHFWMPAQARSGSDELGSPFAEADAYAAQMNAKADAIWRRMGVSDSEVQRIHEILVARTGDPLPKTFNQIAQRSPHLVSELREQKLFLGASTRRRSIDLTSPPLFYAFFAFLPSDYGDAVAVYGLLQFLGFFLGSVLLWRAAGGGWLTGSLLAFVMMVVYRPYRTDLWVGNFNTLHLVFAAVPIYILCGPMRRAESERTTHFWRCVVLGVTAAYVMLKPNFALIGMGIAAHALGAGAVTRMILPDGLGGAPWRWPAVYLRTWATELWTLRGALASTGVVIALLWLWPCLYFRSFDVWSDWLTYIFSSFDKLKYDVTKFNISTPAHLTVWTGVATQVFTLALAVLVAISFVAVLARAPGATFIARVREGVFRTLRDPFAPAAVGLCATVASSHLVWGHYMIAAMIVFAWVFRRDARPGLDFALVLLALVLYGQAYGALDWLGWLGDDSGTLIRHLASLAWLAMWPGVLICVHRLVRSPE